MNTSPIDYERAVDFLAGMLRHEGTPLTKYEHDMAVALLFHIYNRPSTASVAVDVNASMKISTEKGTGAHQRFEVHIWDHDAMAGYLAGDPTIGMSSVEIVEASDAMEAGGMAVASVCELGGQPSDYIVRQVTPIEA